MPQVPRAFPVSPGQARLWYLQQLYPGSSTNNLNVLLRRDGPLDAAILRAALDALVARHEPLRTTFQDGEDGPSQVVHGDPGPLPLASDDLSGLAPGERAAALRALQDRDAQESFDLTRWPLLRLRLVRLGPAEHALIVVVHHVVVDAASIQVLSTDLAELYLAAAGGREPVLPELRIQYVDYVAWQADRLAGPDTQAALDWWRETLAGVPPLRLVPGRPRPVELGGGAEREDGWEPEFGRRVSELGAAVRATPFMTVLAGWAALLARCTGADDFAVGVPMSDRPGDDLDGAIGYFVDMVALRVDLTGDPSFRTLLTRVRDTVIEGFERRSVPFERVVDAAGAERSPAETPLFQVGMNLVQPTPAAPSARHPDFWSDGREYGDGSTKYDLFLTLYAQDDGSYELVVDWRVGLLPDPVAGSLPARLRVLLDAAASTPDSPLSQLPLSLVDDAGGAGGLVAGGAGGLVAVPAGPVLRPWSAPAPGRAGTVVLDGEGWSAGLARSWAATGASVFRSWTPPGGDRPVLGGPWQDLPGASRAPLGRPLTPVEILGPDGRPAPPGLPGQLHVDGPTGVLVRVLTDGQVEYVGPVGAPVRIGGLPVEPAAVEAALLEQPEVAAAEVLVRGDRLVAYVRPVPGTGPTGAALRARLVARLSPAQVPAAIVVLTEPPLRADGTLDPRMLPAAGDQQDTAEHVPPRTPAERRLAEIWAKVLGRDGIGVTDNFFALGGDSFLCLRVVTAATAAGLAITPVDVFARQTIAGIADGLPSYGGEPVVAEVPVSRRPGSRLVAVLDEPVDPAVLAGWPVRVEGARLVGDGAVLDDWTWTALLTALGTGAPLPAPPPGLPGAPGLPGPAPSSGPSALPGPAEPGPSGLPGSAEPPGTGVAGGEWAAVVAVAALDEGAVRAALGGAAVDLVLAGLASVLPGRVVEVSDVDRLVASDRAVARLTLPDHRGQWVETVRAVKEALRSAGDPADPPAVGLAVLPALPAGVRDVDDGRGTLSAPLEVRVRVGDPATVVLRGSAAPAALRELADRLATALAGIGDAVGAASALGSRAYTPSDFPAADLSQDQLDRLLQQLGGG